MNILYYLLGRFFQEEWLATLSLVVLGLVLTLISTNFVSSITAEIIQTVQESKFPSAIEKYHRYVIISMLFLALLYVYKYFQNKLLTKLTQWLKHELLKIILVANNENIQNVNFIEFITPITRIPVSCYILLYDVVSVIIPTVTFLVGISMYFVYKNAELGAFFVAANAGLFAYLYYFWDDMCSEKDKLEVKINENEKMIVDILNNIDKVIYRGQVQHELTVFESKTANVIAMGMNFLTFSTNHIMFMNLLLTLIVFFVLWKLIQLKRAKTIDATLFITLFTILINYRDRISGLIGNISDYLEFVGKLNYILDQFDLMLGQKGDLVKLLNRSYDASVGDAVTFSSIRFEDVSFRYDDQHPFVFEHLDLDIVTDNKIIGITGLSGKGKSSVVKLLLRLYDPTSGKIEIDGVDITTIDPDIIRKQVTYVNQNSKLFDKKVVDNFLYGCHGDDQAECRRNLGTIMEYKKIQELYRNIDIDVNMAGSLGENLSGGQRQIANVISGLVNPSSILILDEPTNALDPDLKEELLSIIKHFRKVKKCIFIITHDRDVLNLFDEVIDI